MMTQQQFVSLKAGLTRAKKKGPEAILAECDRAFQMFEDHGYPDAWHTWNIARKDAKYAIARKNGSW